MRLPITLSLVLIAIGSLRAQAPSLEGTLPEDYLPGLKPLLKEAVERAPSTIAASISLASAEGARYSNAAALWPQLSVSGDYRKTRETIPNSLPSISKGPEYSAAISQPIFQWGAYKNAADIGRLGEKIAERQFADAYRSLAVTIREQYLGLIGKKILLRNAQFNLKLSNEALLAQKARFEAGSSSQAELGNFRMSTEEAQLNADRAEEDFGYAKRVFTRLVGIDDLDGNSIPVDLPHPEFSAPKADAVLAGFVGDGIESTFQNEVYKMLVEQADKSYSIQKVRLLPKISATASLSYSDETSINGNSITQANAQSETFEVAAAWSLFDGFATKGAKMSALANRRLYERQRKTYVDGMIDEMSDMRRYLGFSARGMSIAEVRYALIASEVKRLGQDQTLGYASQASIDSGVLDMYATEYQMAYARTDYFSKWTEFISLAGIDPALANINSRYVR
jgi:outer membrane protein TolC